MRTLKDTVLEKLKVDDIILAEEKFPIDGPIEEMTKFLIGQGYKEIPYESRWDDTYEAFRKVNKSSIMIDRHPHPDNSIASIEFIDKSNSKFKDTLFIIEDLDGDISYNIYDLKNGKSLEAMYKDVFANMINKLF